MENIKASIDFKTYIIDEIKFNLKSIDKKQSDIDIHFNGNTEIIRDKNTAIISLKCVMGEKSDNSPFFLSINMKGFFEYQSNLEDTHLEKIISTNGTAILFPYLRSIITTITGNIGISPIILPTLNINKLLDNDNFSNQKI